MNTLGPKFTLAAAVAAGSAVVTVLSAALQWWALALSALALLGLCLLAALALVRKDVTIIRKNGLPTRAAEPVSTTGATSSGAIDQARMLQAVADVIGQERQVLAEEQEKTLRRVGSELTHQFAALTRLHHRHLPAVPVPLDLPGAMPQQFEALIERVSARPVSKVLTIGAGEAGLWLANAVAAGGGHTEILTARAGEAERLTGLWAEIVQRSAPRPLETSALHATQVAAVVPAVPHAILRWYDLAEATDTYDLVVVWVPTEQAVRATTPALPLVSRLLTDQGHVVVLEAEPERPVATAWGVGSGTLGATDGLAAGAADS